MYHLSKRHYERNDYESSLKCIKLYQTINEMSSEMTNSNSIKGTEDSEIFTMVSRKDKTKRIIIKDEMTISIDILYVKTNIALKDGSDAFSTLMTLMESDIDM